MAKKATPKYSKAKDFESFTPLAPKYLRSQRFFMFCTGDLRNGFEGISELVKKRGINLKDLKPGQYVMFLNHSGSQVKLVSTGCVVAQLRAKDIGTTRLNPALLAKIPQCFGGHSISNPNLAEAYSKFEKEYLAKKLKKYEDQEPTRHDGRVPQQVEQAS